MSLKSGTLLRVGRGFVLQERHVAYGALAGVAIILVVLFLLRHQIQNLSQLGYVGIFLANLAGSASIVVPLPGLAIVLAGGGLWNPIIVGVVGGLGMTLGEITGYALGYGGRGLVKQRLSFRLLERWMRRAGGPIIFVGSLVPNPFFDILGFIAGSQRYPLHLFLLWAFPGKTIKAIGVAFVGALGLEQVLRLLGLALRRPSVAVQYYVSPECSVAPTT